MAVRQHIKDIDVKETNNVIVVIHQKLIEKKTKNDDHALHHVMTCKFISIFKQT